MIIVVRVELVVVDMTVINDDDGEIERALHRGVGKIKWCPLECLGRK